MHICVSISNSESSDLDSIPETVKGYIHVDIYMDFIINRNLTCRWTFNFKKCIACHIMNFKSHFTKSCINYSQLHKK